MGGAFFIEVHFVWTVWVLLLHVLVVVAILFKRAALVEISITVAWLDQKMQVLLVA